ncbi:HAD family hydrolase ['Paenibacillus yunnanensis' Narsing Rao et al. 2020]|uniref:HAD family hydrolase n=1 Tax=Paenibacillus tengchongensis TaxID=2608684 RepID=UPI00124F2F77|nr:HAD family hydrolase [Paenibacillus tengchongensis]
MEEMKGILFDLDNTLMDRDSTFRGFSTQFVCDKLGHLAPEEAQRVVEDIIVRDQDGYRDKNGFFRELSDVLPWDTKLSAEEIRDYYETNYAGHGAIMKDAIDVLEYCRSKGYVLGLVTNGEQAIQDGKIDLLGLRKYFKAIVISGAVGIRKPDPAIYKLALERMETAAAHTLFIGDHPVNDIWGAGKAGMTTIWLKRNHAWDDSLDVHPWKTIHELDELRASV